MNFLNKGVVLEKRELPLNVNASVIIKSLCSTDFCDSISGNVVQNTINKVSVETYGLAAIKFVYILNTPYYSETFSHEFASPTDNDSLEGLVLQNVPDKLSSYVGTISILAYSTENEIAETVLPFRVVRPIEVKHFGKHELAEIYEPQPVTGCIPGSVGNNVNYSETSSETRQNSVSITISNSSSNSISQDLTSSASEGLSVQNTTSTIESSSLSSSETSGESYSTSSSESESNNISFSTSDGESWSWNTTDTNSTSSSNTATNGSNTGLSGNVTTGFSAEGSLPFLAKASGKVEVSAGVQKGWSNSESETASTSNTSSRGYSASGNLDKTKTFGSSTSSVKSHTLSGSYAATLSNTTSTSNGNSYSSGKVWNMSESISSGKVLTQNNQEAINETIVSSSTSSTTFSYSAYIPRGRFGIFYRQTSRYVKISEVITYDLNGFPNHSGFIIMNSWAWAPELSIGESCSGMPGPSLPEAVCHIPPCGE